MIIRSERVIVVALVVALAACSSTPGQSPLVEAVRSD